MSQKQPTRKWMFFRLLSVLLSVVMLSGNLSGVSIQADAAPEQAAEETSREDSVFQHPGLLHTEAGFDRIKENVQNELQPNLETWNVLNSDGFSSSTWNPRPTETVVRGGSGSNFGGFYVDIRRAYQNALIWKINGSKEHGEAACRILNAWSGTMKYLTGNADRFLAAGIYGYTLANAAELMRDHPDFDQQAMEKLLLEVFYPINDNFLRRHNGAHIGNYWANWDLCNIAGMMSIGVFCDRQDIYQQALDYYKTGLGNGSIYNTMPYVYENGLVQWQESGRDQGHTTLGISLCEVICETAWNQGDDLYGLSDNRLLKAAEYVARYNDLQEELPYSPYEWLKGQTGQSNWMSVLSDAARGSRRPVYSMIYNHYVNRKGLASPTLEKIIKSSQGDYVIEAASTNGDELGWQTLTFANLSDRVEDRAIEGDFADGIYRIRSVLTGKSLVDQEGSLVSASKGSREEEWWQFQNKGDGEYIVTNVATGRVLQVCSDNDSENNSEYYSYGTRIGTGEADGSLQQNFAFVKNNSGDYRIIPTINYLALSLQDNKMEEQTPIIQNRNHSDSGQKWIIEKASDLGAEFSFDDEISGFTSDYAQAKGSYTLAAHGDQKALSLNGTDNFLEVESRLGGSVLDETEEFTVSFEVKPEAGTSNWMFYAASAGNSQADGTEACLGIWEENGIVTVERQKEGAADKAVVHAKAGTNGWYQVAVVFAKEETILYINGEEKARQAGGGFISDILGKGSLLQIGKANRGQGAYYKGMIDQFKLTCHAMTRGEILAGAADYAQITVPEVLVDLDFDDEETGLTGGEATANGSYSLKEHNDGQVLYLNGDQDCLKVTAKDGGTLIPGGLIKEMTISLQAKKEGGIGWVFYASENDYAQNLNCEKYLGILDNNGKIVAERYANQGARLPQASGSSQADRWHYITVVFTETEIVVYDNGDEKARTENDMPLSEILGGDSIWYIGKGNWGTGEYFQGMIDNYKVVSRAWSEEEIKAEALKYVDRTQLLDAIDQAQAKDQSWYTKERWDNYNEALTDAKAVLADTQALQSAVDQAADVLNDIQSWMRLDEALHETIVEEKQAEYTEISWEPYQSALTAAKEMQSQGTANRSQVDEAVTILTAGHCRGSVYHCGWRSVSGWK